MAIPTESKDINDAYDDACHVLTTKAVQEQKKVDPDLKQADCEFAKKASFRRFSKGADSGPFLSLFQITLL